MPTYHVSFTYTELGRRKLKNLDPQGRRASVENAVESIGGTLVSLYWDVNLTGGSAIVEGDTLTIIDMTALATQVASVGYVWPTVNEVLDTAQFAEAVSRSQGIVYEHEPVSPLP